ncbi:MAG: acetylxylan esterase, partial [Bacteroidota bacterium]
MKEIVFLITFILITQVSFGQLRVEFEPNYDESKVPEFEVPDPLRMFNGRKIRNQRRWEKKGRPELLEFFTRNVY